MKRAYASAKKFASHLRDKHDISKLVSETAVAIAGIIGSNCPDDYRLTLYVPDLIFDDRLFQLTEYYNKFGHKESDGRAGRSFSIRFGVIGRTWRSGIAEIEGDLIGDEDRKALPEVPTADELERFIARRWGMSLPEAVHVRQYNSYGAFRLERADNHKLGLLYFDSKMTFAFGARQEMNRIENDTKAMLKNSELVLRLLEISSDVAAWTGRIRIYRNS